MQAYEGLDKACIRLTPLLVTPSIEGDVGVWHHHSHRQANQLVTTDHMGTARTRARQTRCAFPPPGATPPETR